MYDHDAQLGVRLPLPSAKGGAVSYRTFCGDTYIPRQNPPFSVCPDLWGQSCRVSPLRHPKHLQKPAQDRLAYWLSSMHAQVSR